MLCFTSRIISKASAPTLLCRDDGRESGLMTFDSLFDGSATQIQIYEVTSSELTQRITIFMHLLRNSSSLQFRMLWMGSMELFSLMGNLQAERWDDRTGYRVLRMSHQTTTMVGDIGNPAMEGLVPRVIAEFFKKANEVSCTSSFAFLLLNPQPFILHLMAFLLCSNSLRKTKIKRNT